MHNVHFTLSKVRAENTFIFKLMFMKGKSSFREDIIRQVRKAEKSLSLIVLKKSDNFIKLLL